ncbi:uncharacterized protein LOC125655336 [Ostrea edulis]|uniref:uncharacterized protein LOC125655336 n=1 Tax=Ostrea edulis TaxID=37623 RepID=UPI0024AE8C90|nr:uncharacterized protein LOC125655336 [Ostrea edulis]XP_055999656.1 uncharacterized protein LOC125655336 [Ostrea edulis]
MTSLRTAGLFAVFLNLCFRFVDGEAYCYYRYYYQNYYCYYTYTVDNGSLSGIIGGVISLLIIIGVVACIIRAKYNRSRVVAISGNTGTSVNVTSVNTVSHAPPPPPQHYPQPNYGFAPQPNQPMYAGGNPAYPPGHHY